MPMYQYSLPKQGDMLGTNTNTLSLLLALFLCFLSGLGCRTFRFLHLFIGFVFSRVHLLLKSKHSYTTVKKLLEKP